MNRLSQLTLPTDLSHMRIRDVALVLLGGNTKHPGLPYLASLMFIINRRNKVARKLLAYWQAAREWSSDPYWATGLFEQLRELARTGQDRGTIPLLEECNVVQSWLAQAQRNAMANSSLLSTVDQVLEAAFHLPDDHDDVVALQLELNHILDEHQREMAGLSGAGSEQVGGFSPRDMLRLMAMGGLVPIIVSGARVRPGHSAEIARRDGQLVPTAPQTIKDGPRAKIYDPEDARAWLRRSPARTASLIPDENSKLRRLMEELANGDPTRPLAQIPGTLWGKPLDTVVGGTLLTAPAPAVEPVSADKPAPKRKRTSSKKKTAQPNLDFLHAEHARTRGPLAALYKKFPHFADVLDFLSAHLALAACGADAATVKFPPILLRGEPGTGKTYFAQMLAQALGTPFFERDLSISTEAFVLSGMDSGWKNSRPGLVFEAVVRSAAANPLILLNEVDKAAVSGTHNSPIAPMYSLLEPTSARAFVDEFASIPVDASHVLWVLTANDGHIPEPILSRLEVFDIKPPTPEQCRLIAESVWEAIFKRDLPKGHSFPEQLPEEVLEEMSRVSPRVMRKQLTAAAAKAAFEGRQSLSKSDLDAGSKRYAPQGGTRIGFMKDV